MDKMLYVGLGGAVGVMMRYGLLRMTPVTGAWPWATFTANMLGCFAIGMLAAWLMARGQQGGALWAFLVIGILGGLTTFSTFAFEIVTALRQDQVMVAVAYPVISVITGVVAVMIGAYIARGWV